MKKIICFILMTAVSAALYAQVSEYDYIQGVNLRKQKLVNFFAEGKGYHNNFGLIAARIHAGDNIEQCRNDFLTALKKTSGDMFFVFPMMSCYLYGYPYWNEEIHAKVRDVWGSYLAGRGDTENHWVIWHVAMLLAAQTWPDMKWANGRTSEENYKDAEGFLNSWFVTLTTIGSGEFDSPCYIQAFLAPMFLLYDFVKDPVLKHRMEMAIDWMMADYAIDYLSGAYTGGHSRIYDRDILNPGKEGGDIFGYIFFGESPFPKDSVEYDFAAYAGLTSYIPPEIIYNVAIDRTKPYVVEKRKRVRNVIRFSDVMNPPVYKMNYMSKNFSIGCNDGGLQQPIQIHTWGVTYLYDDPASGARFDEIFAIHPYYSDYELGMFFAEKLKIFCSEVVKAKPTYDKEDKWTGGSPFEKMYQYKNALIGLYDLDKNTPYKHVDYHFPPNLKKKESDPSGWIFCQGGNAYIAIRPFKPGEWKKEETCDRLVCPGLRNGYVCEAFEASEFKSWDDFKAKMLQTRLDLSKLDSDAEVEYATTGGDVMKFKFPDKRYLNGNVVDYSSMPLFRSPYVNGNDRVMNVTYGAEEMIIDFNKDEIVRKLAK